MRASIEVADIFRAAGPAYRAAHAGHLSLIQLKVMSAIEHCRTAALGGHVEACEDYGQWRIAYNSCRNRHCPKCQGAAARTWLAEREAALAFASSPQPGTEQWKRRGLFPKIKGDDPPISCWLEARPQALFSACPGCEMFESYRDPTPLENHRSWHYESCITRIVGAEVPWTSLVTTNCAL